MAAPLSSTPGMRRRLGAIVGALALAAALGAPAGASAAFGIGDVSATPDSTDAGANTNFAISIGIDEPEHHIRDLTIHLPPGLVGNPLAAPTCPVEQLNQDNCPEDTQVGTTSSDVDVVRHPRSCDPADGQRRRLQPRSAPGRAGPVRDRAQADRWPAPLDRSPGHPPVGGQPAPGRSRARHRAQGPARGDLGLRNADQAAEPHAVRPGGQPAAGLHPPADLLRRAHGRRRRGRLRRPGGKRPDHLHHRQLRRAALHPRALRAGQAAARARTKRSSSRRRSRRRSTRRG